MVENSLIIFCLSYTFVFVTFIVSLWISQYLNSPRVFYFISIISSISMMLIPIFLTRQSPSPLTLNIQLNLFIGALSILLTLKFFELAFSYKWTYIRQMPLKLAAMYIISLPQMPESEAKLLELSKQNVRWESIPSIVRGVCYFIILQTLFYLIPSKWLTLPSSLIPPVLRYIRYGLFSIILYLFINSITCFGFGIYSFITNLRMKPVFPAFPFLATSLREFWSHRWNKLIQSSLHLISFVAIPNLFDSIISMNRTVKSLLAFTISGFIHEYVLWFGYNRWSGKYMIFFYIHAVLILLEMTIKLPGNPITLTGKIMGWIWTTGMILITLPLFFDPIVESSSYFNVR